MRRLPAILLKMMIVIIVLLALLVSALRLVMPLVSHYKNPLLEFAAKITESQISADNVEGRFDPEGPVVNIRNLSVQLKDGSKLQVSQINLALNIWQSILHGKLQFKNLLFKQLAYQTKNTLSGNSEGNQHLQDIFLQRFDHFRLEDSQVQFISPSGKPVNLTIPFLTWYNDKHQHKAEGEISLSSFTGQHGSASLRLSLFDTHGKLDNGEIWLQARDVDVRPWIGQWLSTNTSLKQAQFTLTNWIRLKQGQLSSGDIILTQGSASWKNNSETHSMAVRHIAAHLQQQDGGWLLSLPQMQLSIDGNDWPASQVALYWQPEKETVFSPAKNGAVRLRATNLDIQRLTPLIPLFSRLPQQWNTAWEVAKPQGTLDTLALDIPLSEPENTRFRTEWHEVSWQAWQHYPGLTHLQGSAAGNIQQAEARISIPAQQIDTQGQFSAPLYLEHFTGNLGWQYQQHTWQLEGKKLDLSARSLRGQGAFLFRGGENITPYLSIQADLQTDNGADAWRYFPLKIMSSSLVNYLSDAIRGGRSDNAKLSFSGNPRNFPFKNHEGHFQVTVPLKAANYAFMPNWPELKQLDLSLNFENNSLLIHSPKLSLVEGVGAKDIEITIPDYAQHKLYVKAKVEGQGEAVSNYFQQTPLKTTVGSALQQLIVTGPVSSSLQLAIPLDGSLVKASGDVSFSNNQLEIKPLQTHLTGVTGNFEFQNGRLFSKPITANWNDQPLTLSFTTKDKPNLFGIDVALKTELNTRRLAVIPASWASLISGHIPLNGKIAVEIGENSRVDYSAEIKGDVAEVSGYLPDILLASKERKTGLEIAVNGDLRQFRIKGQLGNDNQFITEWGFSPNLQLERGLWQSEQTTPLSLQKQIGLTVNLSDSQAQQILDKWPLLKANLATFTSTGTKKSKKNRVISSIPLPINVTTKALAFADQTWRNVKISLLNSSLQQPQFSITSDEIKGHINVSANSQLAVNLDYFYYNPQQITALVSANKKEKSALREGNAADILDFNGLPDTNFRCQQCWFNGQNFGKVSAKLHADKQRLLVTEGEIDDGATNLTFAGDWNNVKAQQRTAIKGRFRSDNLARSAQRFGVTSPLHAAGVSLDYDLHWQNSPWQPDIRSLSGLLKLDTGKGQIDNVATGHAGQFLRLFSIDALLRRLKMDFKETLSNVFYFDKIAATAWIEQGVLQTDNLQIDGLEADIALKGNVDLPNRKLNLEALITPEIATPAGVATAFAFNPLAGAAVFIASKVLSPWWSKISLLHYSIQGPINKPKIEEITNTNKRAKP